MKDDNNSTRNSIKYTQSSSHFDLPITHFDLDSTPLSCPVSFNTLSYNLPLKYLIKVLSFSVKTYQMKNIAYITVVYCERKKKKGA